MDYFFKKPTEKELMRQGDRQLRSANRELGTDLRQLERKEKELEQQIKSLAKSGQKEACTLLAKQLVQLRKQKQKNVSMNATISSTGIKNRQMNSMNTMAKAIGSTAQTMNAVNQKMPIAEFAKNMNDFAQAQGKMDLQSEVIEETLDSMLDVDEAEEDKVISQVLDEIGIEMNSKMSNIPRIKDSLPSLQADKSKKSTKDDEIDIEQMLADLRK